MNEKNLVLITPDGNNEVFLNTIQANNLLGLGVIKLADEKDWEPVPGEIAFEICDDYEEDFVNCSGVFEFLSNF